jgi:hypothetical protein
MKPHQKPILREQPAGTRDLLYYPAYLHKILQDIRRYTDMFLVQDGFLTDGMEGLTIDSSSIPHRAELVDFYEGTTKVMIT